MLSEEEELFKSQFSEQGATVSLGISIPFYQRNLPMNPKFLLFYHQLEGKILWPPWKVGVTKCRRWCPWRKRFWDTGLSGLKGGRAQANPGWVSHLPGRQSFNCLFRRVIAVAGGAHPKPPSKLTNSVKTWGLSVHRQMLNVYAWLGVVPMAEVVEAQHCSVAQDLGYGTHALGSWSPMWELVKKEVLS